ncbi:MAG: ribbon-helix-helix protein, CopG family [Deltaproteobacteria bacterium]|nr:ribbon-helix-helix protein, CopG family [Deltaproteobacteria bacterium]
MVQVLIQLDEETLRRLEEVAPGRSRQRSEFIRRAVQRALQEEQERRTALAYRRTPDDEPAFFDPATWEQPPAPRARRRRSGKRP